MLHIAVRLFCGAMVALLALASGVVGGMILTAQYDHGVALAYEPKQPVPLVHDKTASDALSYMPKLSRCSAPDKGASLVQSLEKLVRDVEPTMPSNQVEALAIGPLFADVKERVPDQDVTVVGVATTICVVRHINDDRQIVWRVEFLGNKATLQER